MQDIAEIVKMFLNTPEGELIVERIVKKIHENRESSPL